MAFLILTIISVVAADGLSLCEYFRRLGISSLPLCTNYFHSCMPSSSCESGTLCLSDGSSTPCCTSISQKECPYPDSLNIRCRKVRAVNWCSSDFDCRGKSTMPAKCCATGCNYNMCVNLGVPQTPPQFRRFPIAFSSLQNDEVCPDPYTLPMMCTVRNPTSWCLTDAECPSRNSLHPRKCCSTVCGYNVCLVKYNGKWVIG
ncbi:hypothetical protein Q1695_003606 [Nippostrongylus brasiliensis]|nr:hypothetical protein Q1695_003606 [Nippostrongylus brasiliensis]